MVFLIQATQNRRTTREATHLKLDELLRAREGRAHRDGRALETSTDEAGRAAGGVRALAPAALGPRSAHGQVTPASDADTPDPDTRAA